MNCVLRDYVIWIISVLIAVRMFFSVSSTGVAFLVRNIFQGKYLWTRCRRIKRQTLKFHREILTEVYFVSLRIKVAFHLLILLSSIMYREITRPGEPRISFIAFLNFAYNIHKRTFRLFARSFNKSNSSDWYNKNGWFYFSRVYFSLAQTLQGRFMLDTKHMFQRNAYLQRKTITSEYENPPLFRQKVSCPVCCFLFFFFFNLQGTLVTVVFLIRSTLPRTCFWLHDKSSRENCRSWWEMPSVGVLKLREINRSLYKKTFDAGGNPRY